MDERDPVPISALQHMLYCPRQCALIHVERQWSENRLTAEGRLLHAKVDTGATESRGPIRTERSVPLRSYRLGLYGVADAVDIHQGQPFPVEYKRGRPKAHRADEVQLCAQAMCLEEMLGAHIPSGALFYGSNRRRQPISFDQQLRTLTECVAEDVHALMAVGATPKAEYTAKKCNSCSLKDICQPRRSGTRVGSWLSSAVEDDVL